MVVTEGMMWGQDISTTQVLIIGIVEVLGDLTMVLPLLLKRWYNLVPLSALTFRMIMVGAAYTHLQRDEPIIVNIVLFVLAGAVFWLNRRQTGA